MPSLGHYIQRAQELGLIGTFKRATDRIMDELVLWGQALKWRLIAWKGMSDGALLKQMTKRWNSVDALLDHLSDRPGSSFVLPHDSPQETVSLLHNHFSGYVSTVIEAAEAVIRNEFTLLNHVVRFTNDIDWHIEPITGWQWPLWHRNRLVYRYIPTSTRPADLILTWELNRHQHFGTLGIAYWLTSDERYVEAFISQIQSWINTNPLQHGVNWCYGMEVAIRLIAWILAFQFFRGSALFRRQIGNSFIKSIFHHADFIINHLQTTWDTAPNNHLIAESVGLVVVGAVFPEFNAATTWLETGLRILKEQASIQTHQDGVNKEQSTGYHRFITELFLVVVGLSHHGVLAHESIFEDTLKRMLDYIFFTLTPIGTVPMWGDSDYGRALGLGQGKDIWDFRPLLSTGAALFDRAEWKFVSRQFDEEAFWLLGSEGLVAWERIKPLLPARVSHSFPHAGIYIIRDTWEEDSDVAIFRCGSFGLGGEGHCAHSHCDLLSLVLWIGGKPVLVDSGTYIYYGQWRDYFRLTSAHNTLMVDGYEQAQPLFRFGWKDVPQAELLAWDGRHVVGAMHLPHGVWHKREINHPKAGIWEITDHMECEGTHTITWFFHFPPDLTLQQEDDRVNVMINESNKPFVQINTSLDIRLEIRSGWYSFNYCRKEPNPLLLGNWHGEIPIGGINFDWRFDNSNID
jgi:hypothetical protein